MNENTEKDNIDAGKQLLITHAPHIWKGFSVSKIMYIVVAALLFPAAASVYFFGYYSIILILVSVAVALLTEFIIKKLRHKSYYMDGSALVTGLLFALTLPPRLPIWMAVIGAAFSIAIAREAFGGLGYNIFNPALAGRAFLSICFSKEMTTWVLPTYLNTDAVTGASPLSESFTYQIDRIDMYKNLLFGNTAGSLGETSALIIIIPGILLLALRIIDWRIPLFCLGTVAAGSFLLGEDVVYQLLAGGLMLGAFFMATDYVTSPVTGNGRIIFAIGTGVLIVLFRNYGPMPEGVAFSILIMNGFAPLIDKYVKPKPFGYKGKKKNA
jgi:Na+-translocating ferredoxin:NAD+ oxidoreductase subunit D